jgi:hypothetical protein
VRPGGDSTRDRHLQLANAEQRFVTNPVLRIRDDRPLWISAAGQWDEKEEPDGSALDISRKTAIGPMNLGDLGNVVVVTACKDCTDHSAELMENANYSKDDKLVHLAAPGTDIPGAATSDEYCSASGTSQAAAFVAGTAAAMIGCYPLYYDNRPDRVKTRLQVTSRPALVGDDADKIATGILDLRLALKDPQTTWMQTLAEQHHGVEPEHWCVSDIHLQNPENGEVVDEWYSRVENIYRIVRYRRTQPGGPKQWVIYKRRGEDVRRGSHVGEVIKLGPGVWDMGARLIKLKGREQAVTLDDFEDLLLAQPLRERKPC